LILLDLYFSKICLMISYICWTEFSVCLWSSICYFFHFLLFISLTPWFLCCYSYIFSSPPHANSIPFRFWSLMFLFCFGHCFFCLSPNNNVCFHDMTTLFIFYFTLVNWLPFITTRWYACALSQAYKTNALDSVIIVNQR